MCTALVEGRAALCTRTNPATYAKGNSRFQLFSSLLCNDGLGRSHISSISNSDPH